jgi:hypothetical protein
MTRRGLRRGFIMMVDGRQGPFAELVRGIE